MLAKVIDVTPVGDYDNKEVHFTTKDGEEVRFTTKVKKTGGTLKRGWTGGREIDAITYAMQYLDVVKSGDTYSIEIVNPVKYAPYVEYGHRTRDHKGWVEGKLMLTNSEYEIWWETPDIVEQRIEEFLKRCFNDNNS